MSKHSIIVIKNNKNEYLQYYDVRWNSYLFLNCKLNDDFNEKFINEYISKILNIDIDKINSKFISKKVHTKFSESAKKEKEYEHYFYNVTIKNISDLSSKNFIINDVKYCWYSYDELLNDERIQKVNSDIVSFIKDFNL